MDKFLQMCDNVAPQLIPFGEFNQHTFLRDNKEIKIEQRDFEHVLYHLEADGYLNRISTSSYEFTLTGKGRMFIAAGCYKNKIKEDTERDLFLKAQIQSTIDTNESVQATNRNMIANMQKQKNLTIASIIVASASALFSLGSVYVSSSDHTSQRLDTLSSVSLHQSKTLENMQQSQRSIALSMERIADS